MGSNAAKTFYGSQERALSFDLVVGCLQTVPQHAIPVARTDKIEKVVESIEVACDQSQMMGQLAIPGLGWSTSAKEVKNDAWSAADAHIHRLWPLL